MPTSKKTHSFILLVGILLITTSCQTESQTKYQSKSPNLIPAEPKLLFKSGFENDVYIDNTSYEDSEDYRFIKGTDTETGFSWPINILGAKESGLHYIDDYNQRAVFAKLQTVKGHDGKQTRALYQQENYQKGVTQCPYQIDNIKEGTKDLYIKFRIKLDRDSLYQPNMWRTYFEWKSKDYAKGSGFRLISFIYTDKDGLPYWHFQGDKNPRHPLWEIDNRDIPVPADEWFLNEFYWHWSEGEDGIALWKVNGQVIGEHHGPTTRNGKPVAFIILCQIYGDANPKHQWIDDIEIWDGIPTDTSQKAP
jgi:hypothetical protein